MVATGECSRYVVTGRSNYLWMPVQDALWDQSDDYDGIRSKTSKPIAAILYTMHALCWLNLFFCLCRGRVSTFYLRSILHCGRLSRSNLSSWLCCASLAIESDPAADTLRVCGRGFRRCLQVHRVRGVAFRRRDAPVLPAPVVRAPALHVETAPKQSLLPRSRSPSISSSLVAEPARSRSRSVRGPVVTFRDQTTQADLNQDEFVQILSHRDLSQEIANLDQRLFDRELAADLRTCLSRTDSLDQELRDQRARTDFLEAQLTRNDSLLRALQSSSESRVEALQCSHNILWGKYCRLLDSLWILLNSVDVICDSWHDRPPFAVAGARSDATRVRELVRVAMERLPNEDLPNPSPQTYQYGNQDPARSTASSSAALEGEDSAPGVRDIRHEVPPQRAASDSRRSSEPAASTASGSNIPQLHTILEEHRYWRSPPRSPIWPLEESPVEVVNLV